MHEHAPKKKPVILRRIKNWLLSIIGLTVILMAIGFTLARVAIKSIPDYTAAIQAAVSEQSGLFVEVGFIDAEIEWLVPRLNLFDVNIYDAEKKQHILHLDEIDLSLDWATTLKTMLPAIGEITLVGLNVQISVDENSQLLIQNFVLEKDVSRLKSDVNIDAVDTLSVSENLKYYVNNLNFKILKSQLRFHDKRNNKYSKTFRNFNLRLLNSGDEHTFEIKADLEEKYGDSVHLILDVDGDLFDYKNLLGEIYLSIENINAAPWVDDYWADSGIAANAKVNAQLWLNWDANKITTTTGQFSLTDVAIHYLDSSVKTWELDQLDGQFKWDREKHGWQADVRNIKSIRKGKTFLASTAAQLIMNDVAHEIDFQADFLRIEGLTYFLGLLSGYKDEDIAWVKLLEKHKPTGDLKYIDLSVPVNKPENIKLNTEFENIGFLLPGFEPRGVSNLKGAVAYYGNNTWLALDSENSSVYFNQLFRKTIEISRLKGAMVISNLENKWHILTNSLQVDNAHISTENRFDFYFTEKGEPFLDLTTYFKNGDASFISQYLPVSIMGKDTVEWLDEGIISGKIVKGGYQFYGYLNNMPFRENQGVSLADFEVADVHLNYFEDWPHIKELDGHLRFKNDSMHIDLKQGRLLGSKINQATAYIDNFYSPALDIKGNISIKLADIQQFMANSGLRKHTTGYIENIELMGEGDLNLELFIPLNDESQIDWGGLLTVNQGGLRLINENYKFTDITGSFQFADNFVEAPSLQARLDDKPVYIDVKTSNVGGKKVYQVDLTGNLNASSLLSPLPDVQEFLEGSADWDINIGIASSVTDATPVVDIYVKSDLRGVKSSLPEPIGKEADVTMPLKLNIQLSPDSYMQYDLSLEDDKNIKIRERDKSWLLILDAPNIRGKLDINKREEVVLPIKVDLDYFNVNEFSKHLKKDLSRSNLLQPRDIPSIELKAKKLIWKNFDLKNIKLSTQQTKLGMAVKDFSLEAKNYSVQGEGSWYSGWKNQQITSIDANINIQDLGSALKELDITEDIEGARGSMSVRWKWEAMPQDFSWELLQGDGRLSLKNGTIEEIDVGAGRILGIFNFRTLLSLDFVNQVSKGFSFDKASGTFSFSGGNAYTDDLLIESKVADVLMNGRLGIKDKTIDQKVTVRPHVGSTVTLGSTVVAGPVVGGLVYLFQKVFDPDSLSEYQYSMKGDISDPEVKLLSKPASERATGDIQDEENDF